MNFYKRGFVILCGVVIWETFSRFVRGHPWTDVDWLGATMIGLGIWIAWMLSDVMTVLQAIREELEELRSER